MNNMKQTILGLFAALILMTASCSNDEKMNQQLMTQRQK